MVPCSGLREERQYIEDLGRQDLSTLAIQHLPPRQQVAEGVLAEILFYQRRLLLSANIKALAIDFSFVRQDQFADLLQLQPGQVLSSIDNLLLSHYQFKNRRRGIHHSLRWSSLKTLTLHVCRDLHRLFQETIGQ